MTLKIWSLRKISHLEIDSLRLIGHFEIYLVRKIGQIVQNEHFKNLSLRKKNFANKINPKSITTKISYSVIDHFQK